MQTAWKRRQATTRVANTKVTVDYATVSPPIPRGARSHPGTGRRAIKIATPQQY